VTDADRKKLETIADDILESIPIFLRRMSKGGMGHDHKKHDPSVFVLHAVWKHGPVRMSEIGRHMGVSRPYMTMLVDRLIADGLVERVPDPEDRRVVNVMITEDGRDAVRAFMKNFRETVIGNLSSLDSADIVSLHESMRLIKSIASKLERKETEDCKLN
jgi:MarR family 2-MHQ and catechol resistance regulon transcriptional repressor